MYPDPAVEPIKSGLDIESVFDPKLGAALVGRDDGTAAIPGDVGGDSIRGWSSDCDKRYVVCCDKNPLLPGEDGGESGC